MPLGRLVQVELENFKSYRGHQIIGPFHQFTSIIGPNGAGKSNLMDAISFVLGVKSAQLRSGQLRELIYRGAAATANDASTPPDDIDSLRPTTCSVSAVLETAEGNTLVFKRTVLESGTSEYRVNGRVRPYEAYNRALEQQNLLVKAKNFLVFQGDVEAVAVQTPMDLTRMIETISGSAAHAPEYERLKALQNRAADAFASHFSTRRGITAQVKHVQAQQDEAERYESVRNKQRDLTTRETLFRVAATQSRLVRARDRLALHRARAAQAQRALGADAAAQQQRRRDLARAQRDLLTQQRRAKEARRARDGLQPSALRLQTRRTHLEREMERVRREREREAAALAEQRETAAGLTRQLQQMDLTLEAFEAKASRDVRFGEGQITKALVKAYDQTRRQVDGMTESERERLAALRRAERQARHRRDNAMAERDMEQPKLDQVVAALRKHDAQAEALTARYDVAQLALDDLTTRQQEADTERRRLMQTEADLNERLKETQRALVDARDVQQLTARETRQRETLAALTRLLGPGRVHGTVAELGRPVHERDDHALSVLLGRHADAIVTDSKATAMQCIAYLREQRLGQAMFLPLDTVEAPRDLDRNRETVRRLPACALALDRITFDAPFTRIFQMALGNSVICESLDVARRVVFDHKIQVKAVTPDGDVVHKSGLMTGGQRNTIAGARGSSGNRRALARRSDERQLNQLLALRTQLAGEMADIIEAKRNVVPDETFESDRARLQKQLSQIVQEQQVLSSTRSGQVATRDALQARLAELTTAIQQHGSRLAEIENEIREVDAVLYDVEKREFASFCKEAKFKHVRDYEERYLDLNSAMEAQRLALKTQTAKLMHAMTFAQERIDESVKRLAEFDTTLSGFGVSLAEIDAEESKLTEQTAAMDKDAEALEATVTSLTNQVAELEAALQQERKAQAAQRREADALAAQTAVGEAELERVRADLDALFRRCKFEQIHLPLAGSDSDFLAVLASYDAEAEAEALASQAEDPNEEDDMEVDGHPTAARAAEPATEAMTAEIAALEREREALRAQLERMAPVHVKEGNLASAQERLQRSTAASEAARREAKAAREHFQPVRQARFDTFMRAFEHISARIDRIYKLLTASRAMPTGGTAYLSLENSDEPYLEGIKYHAVPPMKRFRDIEQLSGGEKTVAALALLFAVHTYRPAPFFVLDEVDAALDNTNVAKVTNYIRRVVSAHRRFIIISLKHAFYERAQALVGIYKDQARASSRVLTLDLDQPADAAAAPGPGPAASTTLAAAAAPIAAA
ncbi:hypothetical protein CXG81DRAFT_14460 [Caulochytrium protostelioides]|uniref:Structural maintenance of chromosomes protein n=1 Tax=Caulochytrium protostelioides TaxID=1555241 RepID=A0A4P9X374_9FUNG|nr:hypothetical protein CXG81DRAFT_14460 [Caulochytrium protostelioides]|eukprot:RKO99469.1 hypothetical protein CXG81DRAFT_14460 [Caulochytrium protostelioides]